MRRHVHKFWTWLLYVILTVGAVALIRDTYYQGQDFEVFWRAANRVLAGQPLYSISSDGMVFKYPPWIVPFFFPLAWLPLGFAKTFWGLVQVFSIGSVGRWLVKQGCNTKTVLLLIFAFWGVWAVHALDGQITLVLLAISLGCWPGQTASRWSSIVMALTTKIFSLFSLLGLFVSKNSESRAHLGKKILITLSALILLSLPALISSPGRSPSQFFMEWKKAASSGGELLEGEKVRGRDNQGFPALILRQSQISASDTQSEVLLSFFLCFIFGVSWFFLSRKMKAVDQWVGWLALGVVIHPLAWIHSFVFSFPLLVLAFERGISQRRVSVIFLSVVTLVCLAFVSRNTLGALGIALELGSIRSWGVLVGLFALWLSARKKTLVTA